jgi:hypothetical protein
MRKEYPLSVEEESAMEALGGFDEVAAGARRILSEHGIDRDLFSPEEQQRVHRGRDFAKRQVEFHFDSRKSLLANISDLLTQAAEIQEAGGGINYVGAMLQHLVGAKLDFVVGEGRLTHHGFSVADQSTARQADYQIENSCIHVTTHPSEALARKCAENLSAGMRPLIVTLAKSVQPAEYLLESAGIADRVDVLDAAQFLTANVYERSLFKTAECKVTLTALLDRYNAIIAKCETDPSLLIKIPR